MINDVVIKESIIHMLLNVFALRDFMEMNVNIVSRKAFK